MPLAVFLFLRISALTRSCGGLDLDLLPDMGLAGLPIETRRLRGDFEAISAFAASLEADQFRNVLSVGSAALALERDLDLALVLIFVN